MSQLTPFPDVALLNCPDFLQLDYSLEAGLLDYLENFCTNSEDYNPSSEGTETGGIQDSEIRQCKLKFFDYKHENTEMADVFQNLLDLTSSINDAYFRFDLTGFKHIQWTEYGDGDGDHYSWHCDKFPEPIYDNVDTFMHRKLSFSLVFSEPDEYEGGDFEVMNSGVKQKCEQKRGSLLIFPSWTVHRVLPVTSGKRKSLVWWAVGPRFR